MTVVLNGGVGLTAGIKRGTYEQAIINAQGWLKNIQSEFPEVRIIDEQETYDVYYGWVFRFIHTVTEKTAWLGIHGYTDEQVEVGSFFTRVWWNDSSTSDACIEDWLTNDFKYKIVYEKKEQP
jgi:hypothetical protein